MKNEDIDKLNDEDKKEYYVTRLERLDSNIFQANFVKYASSLVSLVASIPAIVDMVFYNQFNIPALGMSGLFNILRYCFGHISEKMKNEKTEIQEKLNNEGMGKKK